MDRWHGKHPLPYDFFFTFDQVVGEDLSWFWKPWFFEQGYADLGLEIEENNAIIKRTGSLPVPVKLKVINKDGSSQIIDQCMSVWQDGATEFFIKLNDLKNIASVELDVSDIPDLDHSNNIVHLDLSITQ